MTKYTFLSFLLLVLLSCGKNSDSSSNNVGYDDTDILPVDNEDYITYVAEQNLEEEPNANPIIHPEINYFFSGISNGMYVAKRTKN